MSYSNLILSFDLLPFATFETLYMVIISTIVAFFVGIPLGVVLFLTSQGQLKENTKIYKPLSTLINIGRSFPFAILMIVLIPITRFIVGTSLGTTAAIVPLSVSAAPFFARIVEQSLKGIDRHIIEAAQIMGSTTMQIVKKVLLKEPLASLINGLFNTMINLVGYSAMAGLVGGGGLGKVAIQYGYNQFNVFLMISTVILLIIIVELLQWLSNFISFKIHKKRGLATHE